MKKVSEFIAVNLFLIAIGCAGLGAGMLLWFAAISAGADEDMLRWLYWPIGLVAIISTYYSGKFAHQFFARKL